MGFRPSQQLFQSCRDETTDSWMLRSTVGEIKVSCVWAQHGGGRYQKVQVGNDQEKAQSEDSHSKNRGGKKLN